RFPAVIPTDEGTQGRNAKREWPAWPLPPRVVLSSRRARSGAEARPAPASMLGVRVLEAEPALPELAFDVVDLDSEQVHRAHRVDEALHSLDLEDHVAGPLVLLDVQAVLEARASAADDGDAQAGALQALALDGLPDHGDSLVRQLDGGGRFGLRLGVIAGLGLRFHRL